MKPENNQEVDVVSGATVAPQQMVRQYNYIQEAYNNAKDYSVRNNLLERMRSYGNQMAKYFINKYKGTNYDITQTWTPFPQVNIVDLTPEKAEKELINEHLREYDSGIKDFFKSYVESPGYKRVISNQTEYLKESPQYDLQAIDEEIDKSKIFYTNEYPEYSFAKPFLHHAFVKTGWDGKGSNKLPIPFIEAHEFAHTVPHINYVQEKLVKNNTNTNSGHDSRSNEKHADIWGLKYLLYKEGVHDVRTGEPVTKEHIEKLRKKYPKLRPLQQMDNEKTAWMLNYIAQNTNNPYSDPNRTRV